MNNTAKKGYISMYPVGHMCPAVIRLHYVHSITNDFYYFSRPPA